MLAGDLAGKERDRALWTIAHETTRSLAAFTPATLEGKPRTLPSIDTFRSWLMTHRASGQLDSVQQNALREWSDWRHKLTWAEGENASKLQALLEAYANLGDLRARYPDTEALGRAMAALLAFMHEHYRVKRVPEERDKRRWLARKATVRTDVMPNEWRDPEHREVQE